MKPILTAALAAFALISCSGSAKEASTRTAHPALWKIADTDTTIYLFGTIHALPGGTVWRSKAFDAAMEGSDTLVLEVATLKDQARVANAFSSLASSPGLPPIMERVPPKNRPALAAALARAKLPLAAADKIETWAIALTLVSGSLQRLGITQAEGVEATTQTAFTARGKPTEGLETVEQQFGYFDKLSEGAQRDLLVSTLTDDVKGRTEYAQMVSAWSAGNVAKIAATFDDELKGSPELTEALLRRRNVSWAAWLKRRMDKPGTVFVAVGAGHLAGPNSVLALLDRLGVKAKRVQ